MSSTRHAAPGGEFSQEKFASAAEFERGLIASMVALRCGKLEDPKDRELIWFIHYLSHWGGGLKNLAAALLENYPEHLGTSAMVKLGKRSGQNCNAEQVREIRSELPIELRSTFILKGEMRRDFNKWARQAAAMEALRTVNDREDGSAEEKRAIEKAEAQKHPQGYPIEKFTSLCQRAAEKDLENLIRQLCLDPSLAPSDVAPWYFAGLEDALRAYFKRWTAQRGEGIVKSAVTKQVWEIIDYTARTGQMTLIEGVPRIGKSNAVESWYGRHPGKGRFITVPTGNDDTSFYRAFARGIGLGNLSQYKAMQMRERVETVLLSSNLILLLDEGWRLFPNQSDPRFGFPKRIDWVMSMADEGVPICIISQPDFLRLLKVKEAQGWDSSQFVGRVKYYRLPDEVSKADMLAIAAFHLPEADSENLKIITAYARKSVSYLGAIKTIAQRARDNARIDGRETASAEDVDRAMNENVIPSDSDLVSALKSEPVKRGKKTFAPAVAAELPESSSEDAAAPQFAGGRTSADVFTAGTGTRRQQIETVTH